MPDEGRTGAGLGQARGQPRARDRRTGRVLARSGTRTRRADHREGRALPEGSRHERPRHPRDDAGRRDALLARTHPCGQGHDLGHRQRAARLPDRPVPDHGTRHQREDAVDRAADGRRRDVRNGCGRLRAEARAAVRRGRLPALGFARRIPRARGIARTPRQRVPEPEGTRAREDARPGDRQVPGREQVAGAQGRRPRQPRQPLLPVPVLGAGAGRADRGRGAEGAVRRRGEVVVRQRSAHSGRTGCRAGQGAGHRRLLPSERRPDEPGDAPERDAERHRRRGRLTQAARSRGSKQVTARRARLPSARYKKKTPRSPGAFFVAGLPFRRERFPIRRFRAALRALPCPVRTVARSRRGRCGRPPLRGTRMRRAGRCRTSLPSRRYPAGCRTTRALNQSEIPSFPFSLSDHKRFCCAACRFDRLWPDWLLAPRSVSNVVAKCQCMGQSLRPRPGWMVHVEQLH
ncbi:hypothetical protein BCEP27_70321 [Burkholderia cepacia]